MDPVEPKGYDTGKKGSGSKLHIALDAQGLPHATAVAQTRCATAGPLGADKQDMRRVPVCREEDYCAVCPTQQAAPVF